MTMPSHRHRVLAVFALSAVFLGTISARDAHAIDSCRAKVDKKTGVIRVDATNVGGPLLWGTSAGNENTGMFNSGTCIASGKAKKCELADPTSLASKSPPAGCTLYLDDGVAACSTWIPGCTPGPRASAGALVLDSSGAVIGYSAEASAQFAVHDTGTDLVRLVLRTDGSGFSPSGYTYFTSSDCSGTALLPVDPSMVKYGHIESGNLAYYGAASASPVVLNSSLAYLDGINDQAGCDGYFGPGRTFVAPHGCCWAFTFSSTMGPATSLNLSGFTTPFSVVIP